MTKEKGMRVHSSVVAAALKLLALVIHMVFRLWIAVDMPSQNISLTKTYMSLQQQNVGQKSGWVL